jgi:hypothetical protein
MTPCTQHEKVCSLLMTHYTLIIIPPSHPVRATYTGVTGVHSNATAVSWQEVSSESLRLSRFVVVLSHALLAEYLIIKLLQQHYA